jgi:ankyrin repeat protein
VRTIKKLVPALLGSAALITLIGCSGGSGGNGSDETEPATPASQPEQTGSTNTTPDDASFALSDTKVMPTGTTGAETGRNGGPEPAQKPAQTAPSLGTTADPRSSDSVPTPDPVQKTTVVVEPAELNLGQIATDDAKAGTVVLTNTGTAARKVLDCKTSCGCTTANCQKGKVLQPGESMEVEIKLSGGTRAQKLRKTVTFLVSDQPPIRVPVIGEAVAFVVVEPATIDKEKHPEGRVVVKSTDGEPFTIKSMYPPLIEEFPGDPVAEHEVQISWDKLEELGFRSSKVKLLFNVDHPKASKAFGLASTGASRIEPTAPTAGSTATEFYQARVDLDKLLSDGKTDEVLRLLAEGDVKVGTADKSGQTPLVKAARWGDATVIEALLDEGADISGGDRIGRTPLMYACQSKNLDAVLVLLDAGADIGQRDQIGNTAVCWAAGFGTAEIVKELVDAGAQVEISGALTGFTPLIWAAGFGEAGSVKVLLDAGANIEAADVLQGATPLMNAVRTGGPENAQVLLEAGANLEARDNEGKTALLIAASNAGPDAALVKMILDAGADTTAKTTRGEGVLDLARKRTDLRAEEVIALLESVIEEE